MAKVLITGITGQDGSYLAEEYLARGWVVHGIVRRTSNLERKRIDHLFDKNSRTKAQPLILHYADLNDPLALVRLISEIEPEVIVNLAAQSHVGVSFEVPIETSLVTGLGALVLFEAARIVNKEIKIYQAGSSEMFGGMLGRPILNENSSFYPKSPYAVAKVFAHHSATNFRESFGMKISNGILFNHESPRRGENFVSRKITLSAARISMGLQQKLFLGNLDAKRDWGHAREYAKAISLIAESENSSDYVVATGQSFSVRQFVEITFKKLNLEWEEFVHIDQGLFRPNEVEDLLGDPTKILNDLNWKHSVDLDELIDEMLESDLKLTQKELRSKS
jgi:GDPmannose 4,6-dehydratase